MNKTIKELEKEYAESKEDVIANMTADELEERIMALAKKSYVSYLNDDETEYNSILKSLDTIINEYNYAMNFGNVNEDDIRNFINYCMIKSINSLLNDLMERSFNLKLPDAVTIKTISDDKQLEERIKRKEKHMRRLIMNTSTHKSNMERLIRPDVKMEDVTDGMESLEKIFLPEVIAALNEVMEDANNENI